MIDLFQISQLFPEGQNVWHRNHVKNIWEKGNIIDRDDTSNRSYTLIGKMARFYLVTVLI